MSKPYLGKVTAEEQKQLDKIMNNPIIREKTKKGEKPSREVNLTLRGEKPK